MTSIKDVAAAAGVSIATVSRVMNKSKNVSPDVRARVERAISELDYHTNEIARSLKITKSNRIAVIITSISRTFFSTIIEGIQQEAEKDGYSLIFAETHDSIDQEQQMVSLFSGQWVDGIILASSVNDDVKYADYISRLSSLHKQDTQIPVVTLEFPFTSGLIDAVTIDYEQAAYKAVTRLIERGKKDILHISHPADNRIGKLRAEGYRRALKEAGIDIRDEYIIPGNFTTYSGYAVMSNFIASGHKVDGVYCANDQMAIGVIKYCEDNSVSIPEDIAVFGTDGIFASSIISPTLSTVSIPKKEMGVSAMRLLNERIIGQYSGEQRVITLPFEITERESTIRGAKASLRFLQW